MDFSTEFSGKELVLIQKIKLGDLENDPGLKMTFVAWVNRNLGECEKDEIPQANLFFLLKKAKLLFSAGEFDEAWRDLFDLRTLAANLGREDVVDEANAILLEIAERI